MPMKRVVIADDVVYFRTLLRYALESRFEVVGEAGDGREAVETVKRELPDAIVLDLSMPVMDGLQAIPQIREASPATKILVLSAMEAVEVAEQAMREGADAFLEKGSDLTAISEALDSVLA